MHRDPYGYGDYGESKLLLIVFSPILIIILILLGVAILDEMDKEKKPKEQISITISDN